MNKLLEQFLATLGCYLIETKKVNHKMVHSFYMSRNLSKEVVNEINQQLEGYELKLKTDSWSHNKSLTVTSK